jgi:MYXO-CTERM domain-containing protein
MERAYMPSRHSANEPCHYKEIMNLLTNRFTILTGALSAVVASTASGNIVTNGGFTNGFNGWTMWGTAAPGGGGLAYLGSIGGDPMGGGGLTVAQFDCPGPGGMYQDLSTVAGEEYTVSFGLRKVTGSGNTNSFSLDFGSQTVMSLVNSPTIDPIAYYSFDMTATGSTERLQFNFQSAGFAWTVAAISVTPVPVPAPGAIALIGLAGLAGGRRRRA